MKYLVLFKEYIERCIIIAVITKLFVTSQVVIKKK